MRIIVSLPALVLTGALFFLLLFSSSVDVELWQHLSEYLFVEALFNSIGIALLTALLSLVVGGFCAVVVSFFEFPGRVFFRRAFILSLCFPPYVLGFIFLGALEVQGPIAQAVLWVLGEERLVWPSFQSPWMVSICLSLGLFPYVYLAAKECFENISKSQLEMAQAMGLSFFKTLYRVILGYSKPWLVAGLALVVMESLADFGVVAVFNVESLTTLVYKTWFSFFSLETASQISLIHIALVVMFLGITGFWFRKRAGDKTSAESFPRKTLRGPAAAAVVVASSLLFCVSFVLPVVQLLVWSGKSLSRGFDPRFFQWLFHSVVNSLGAALVVSFFALSIILWQRAQKGFFKEWLGRFSSVGYAIPGTVIAVALMVAMTYLVGPLVSIGYAAVGVLIIGLAMRFFAVGYQALNEQAKSISLSLDEAAESMGRTKAQLWWQLHLPLLKSTIFASSLFVFIDALKEMPMSLMMRPAGWDSLSVKVYEFTSEGEWEAAALPALALVLVGVVASIFLIRKEESRSHVKI